MSISLILFTFTFLFQHRHSRVNTTPSYPVSSNTGVHPEPVPLLYPCPLTRYVQIPKP
ncbi:hypothetical protein M6B38_269140 [Iris pallida]|uniref:Secreted protein n=1 Tax=Iris pallida TaxID=29817 RepID=A0AAX6IAA3_IRIPA|nr:hypothetical protein M6B38_269140 [Iris pallida]